MAPEIKSVFVSGVETKRLFVIVAWNSSATALDAGGGIYQVFVYEESVDKNKGVPALRRDAQLSRRFGIGFDGVREGKRVTYKYKTAASVRRQILDWGFR